MFLRLCTRAPRTRMQSVTEEELDIEVRPGTYFGAGSIPSCKNVLCGIFYYKSRWRQKWRGDEASKIKVQDLRGARTCEPDCPRPPRPFSADSAVKALLVPLK